MFAVSCLWRSLTQPTLCLFLILGLAACSSFEVPALKKLGLGKPKDAEEKPADTPKMSKEEAELAAEKVKIEAEADALNVGAPPATGSNTDLLFLLSMNFEEAKAISAQSVEMPMGVKIAADSIEILKEDGDKKPKKVRAKGRVYLENGIGEDQAKVLCQEAYISSWEIVLRGKPIIQRGGSTIEGLDDKTVAYMLGSRLRVIGMHRLTNQDSMLAMLPDLGPWTAGPNPILPPLTEDSVPNDIRDQMLKAAEAEAVLQQNRVDALKQPDAPPAPWVKGDRKAKTKGETEAKTDPKAAAVPVKAVDKKTDEDKSSSKPKETPPATRAEKPKAVKKADPKKA
jgi:hypothetical protein